MRYKHVRPDVALLGKKNVSLTLVVPALGDFLTSELPIHSLVEGKINKKHYLQ